LFGSREKQRFLAIFRKIAFGFPTFGVLGNRNMASRKVQLYLYIKLQSGWRYCPAAYYSNGSIKPWVAITPDGEKKFPGSKYYVYVARKWELVGSDPAEAVRALEKRNAGHTGQRR
jgi:hypothetical protein